MITYHRNEINKTGFTQYRASHWVPGTDRLVKSNCQTGWFFLSAFIIFPPYSSRLAAIHLCQHAFKNQAIRRMYLWEIAPTIIMPCTSPKATFDLLRLRTVACSFSRNPRPGQPFELQNILDISKQDDTKVPFQKIPSPSISTSRCFYALCLYDPHVHSLVHLPTFIIPRTPTKSPPYHDFDDLLSLIHCFLWISVDV